MMPFLLAAAPIFSNTCMQAMGQKYSVPPTPIFTLSNGWNQSRSNPKAELQTLASTRIELLQSSFVAVVVSNCL